MLTFSNETYEFPTNAKQKFDHMNRPIEVYRNSKFVIWFTVQPFCSTVLDSSAKVET